MVKKFYKGIFQYPRKMYVEYGWSYSERQAYLQMANRIAKVQDVNKVDVLKYFKDNPDKVIITLEKKG